MFEHVAIHTTVGLMYLVRQLRQVSFQDLDEQGSFVVVEGQAVHISFPLSVLENSAESGLQRRQRPPRHSFPDGRPLGRQLQLQPLATIDNNSLW